MKVNYYSMDDSAMQETANSIKESIVHAMKREGALAVESDWNETHVVVVHAKGWFGRTVDKILFREPETTLRVSVLKIV